MDSQPKADKPDTAPGIVSEPPLRVYKKSEYIVPKEATTQSGTVVFRTQDRMVYCRAADGSIRRSRPKVRGKAARKADKAARRQKRSDR